MIADTLVGCLTEGFFVLKTTDEHAAAIELLRSASMAEEPTFITQNNQAGFQDSRERNNEPAVEMKSMSNPVALPGNSVPAAQDGPVCTNCGAPFSDLSLFCQNCGTRR
jgi:hypothetical protein